MSRTATLEQTGQGAGRVAKGGSPSAGARRPGRSRALVRMLGPITLITGIGAALRLSQIDQSLFGDELWSYVGATMTSAGRVLDYVRSDAEITPPLFTILAWLSAKIGDPTIWIRLPSLLAGIATIPLIYAIGLRALDRRAALLAAALAALSPFLAFYSVEARAYGLTIALTAASTLFLLVALDRGQRRWWAGYAIVSCAAMYSHYTAAYVLVAQLVWVLWRHRSARRPALVANVLAAVAYLPWLPSLRDDFGSPSQDTIGALAPFDSHNVVDFSERFSFGHPALGLHSAFGTVAEVVLACGLLLALVGLASTLRGAGPVDRVPQRSDNLLLFGMLALATPVGVALVSLVGTDMFLPRNLAESWPGFGLVLAAFLTSGPRLISLAATSLVLGYFAFGAYETTQSELQRPAVKEVASFIDGHTGPRDVVLDVAIFGVGGTGGVPLQPPALGLDINFNEPHRSIDYIRPADASRALRDAAGHRLAVAGNPFFTLGVVSALGLDDARPVAQHTFGTTLPMGASIYEIPPPAAPRASAP